MCSEIDERTRDNPESAMVHHNEMCQGYMRRLGQNPTMLEVARAYDARQQSMAKQYPGAWPWPTFSMVKFEGGEVTIDPLADGEVYLYEPDPAPSEPQHFDTEAHRAFMRSLG